MLTSWALCESALLNEYDLSNWIVFSFGLFFLLFIQFFPSLCVCALCCGHEELLHFKMWHFPIFRFAPVFNWVNPFVCAYLLYRSIHKENESSRAEPSQERERKKRVTTKQKENGKKRNQNGVRHLAYKYMLLEASGQTLSASFPFRVLPWWYGHRGRD